MTYNAKHNLQKIRGEDSLVIALFVESDIIWNFRPIIWKFKNKI